MSNDNRDYYSPDETNLLLKDLSDADCLKLGKLAKFQSAKVLNMESDDLVQEGLARVLDGTRKWPRGLDIATFMNKVFGSIISTYAKHHDTAIKHGYLTEQDVLGDCDDGTSLSENVSSTQSDIQNIVYAKEMMSRVIDELASDPKVQAVALSIAEGLSAKETQNQFSLSVNEYDAARKRLRRMINSLLSEEMQT